MKKIKVNNYWWIEENNNKWSYYYYSKEQAQKENKSLVNCSDCRKKIKKEKE